MIIPLRAQARVRQLEEHHMNKAQQKRFNSLYQKHVSALIRQGKAATLIDLYSRAVHRISSFFDCPPDTLRLEQFEAYFESLVQTHSWSTVKVDRNVTLPKATLVAMRLYWATHRHPHLIFPHGRNPAAQRLATAPMDRGGLQKSFKAIVLDVGIHKKITIHTLRHCYGTLLTEAGVGLRTIQHEMGHECPKTTALYTQLSMRTEQDAHKRINGLMGQLRILWGQ